MEVGTIWKYVYLRHVAVIIRGISRVTEDNLMKKISKKQSFVPRARILGKFPDFFMHTCIQTKYCTSQINVPSMMITQLCFR